MNDKETHFRDFELIESYLMDEMNSKEQSSFELELKSRPDLRTEMDIQKDLMKSIQIGAMKEELKSIHEEKQSSKTTKSRAPIWAIAASIAVILTVGLLMFDNQPTNEQLFAEYADVDPGLPVTMGTTDNYVFNDAMVDYKRGEYQKALSKWIKLSSELRDSDTLNFYIGMAHFNLENYEDAQNFIQKVESSSSQRLRAKAQYYEVLIALAQNDIGFIENLEILQDSEYERRILEIKEMLEH